MKPLFTLSLLVCLILSSCGNAPQPRKVIMSDSLFATITVNPDEINVKGKRAPLSEFASAVEYIPLETSDSILIGNVEKLIVWKDQYYILDNLTETIFCFDANGKYQKRLYRKGEGPEEYASISDFEIDRKTGDICIYSNPTLSVLVYGEDGQFKSRKRIPFIFNRLAKQDSLIHYYTGRFPNKELYKKSFPEQYRFLTTDLNCQLTNEQLYYVFDPSHELVPLPKFNFTYHKDTLLLTEYFSPKVYTVLPDGTLSPRYRIEFTTNTYAPSFESPIDMDIMKAARKDGNLTTLFSPVFETEHYLFFNFARGLIGTAYVDKRTHEIHNLGYFQEDDINQISTGNTLSFADNDHLYKVEEASSILLKQRKGKSSTYLSGIIDNLKETDNPVIVKITLK